MNRAQRLILVTGSVAVLLLLAIGSWTFASTETKSASAASIPPRTETWSETSCCSILFGTRGHDAGDRPASVFSVPMCDSYGVWREPFLAGIGAAAVLTVVAVLWVATPRARVSENGDDGASSESREPQLS